MADSSGEKTEEPTQKKIDDSRKKGQVWKSKDLAAVGVFLVGMGAVKALWPTILSETGNLFSFAFEKLAHPDDLTRAIPTILVMALKTLFFVTMPIVIAAAVVGGLLD